MISLLGGDNSGGVYRKELSLLMTRFTFDKFYQLCHCFDSVLLNIV